MAELLIPGLPDEISRECLARFPPNIIPAARHVSKEWRAELDSPSFHRLRRANGLVRSVIALAQIDRRGKSISFSLALFDPGSGQWTAPPPVPGGRLPIFCQLAAAGRHLAVLGGWDPATWIPTNELFLFDLASYSWRRGAPIPGPPRSFFACAAAPGGRHVYVAGGHDEEKRSLRSAMVYDFETDAWAALPDMAAERDEGIGVVRGGRFVVVGGYGTDSQGTFSWSAEEFDPLAERWETAAEEGKPCGISGGAVVAGGDGRLYRCVEEQIEVSEGEEMKWKRLAGLPDAGDGKKTAAPRLVILPGEKERLVVFGSGRHGRNSVDVFSMEMGGVEGDDQLRWVVVAPPPEKFCGVVRTACCLEI